MSPWSTSSLCGCWTGAVNLLALGRSASRAVLNRYVSCHLTTSGLAQGCLALCIQRMGGSVDRLPLLNRPKMSLHEELVVSPWDKFRKYKRVPFKLVCNITVTALITAFIVISNQQYAAYVDSSMYR